MFPASPPLPGGARLPPGPFYALQPHPLYDPHEEYIMSVALATSLNEHEERLRCRERQNVAYASQLQSSSKNNQAELLSLKYWSEGR